MRVGLGIGHLELPMLWPNSYGLWQTLENTVNTNKSVVWEDTKFLAESSLAPRHHDFDPDFQMFQQVRRKLLQESGHPQIVL